MGNSSASWYFLLFGFVIVSIPVVVGFTLDVS